MYGYPNKAAADVAIATTRTFLEKHHLEVGRCVLDRISCLFLFVGKFDMKISDHYSEPFIKWIKTVDTISDLKTTMM